MKNRFVVAAIGVTFALCGIKHHTVNGRPQDQGLKSSDEMFQNLQTTFDRIQAALARIQSQTTVTDDSLKAADDQELKPLLGLLKIQVDIVSLHVKYIVEKSESTIFKNLANEKKPLLERLEQVSSIEPLKNLPKGELRAQIAASHKDLEVLNAQLADVPLVLSQPKPFFDNMEALVAGLEKGASAQNATTVNN